jgi:hypothetical protein
MVPEPELSFDGQLGPRDMKVRAYTRGPEIAALQRALIVIALMVGVVAIVAIVMGVRTPRRCSWDPNHRESLEPSVPNERRNLAEP